MNELTNQMLEESEKAKHAQKLKNKYESTIAELEEKLKKEQEVSEVNYNVMHIHELRWFLVVTFLLHYQCIKCIKFGYKINNYLIIIFNGH